MKKMFLVLMFLVLVASVSALEFSADYYNDVIVYDMDNSIELVLTIDDAPVGLYNVYTFADVRIKPSEMFSIDSGSVVKTFTVEPNENLDVDGYYTFVYVLNQRNVEKFEKTMLIKLVRLEDSLEISSDSIDPASGEVSFYVRNLENSNLRNVTARFSSILFDVEKTFDLGPNEKLEFVVDVDEDKLKSTKAGAYIIKSVFETKKGKKGLEGVLYLGEKKGITSFEDRSGILVRDYSVTKVNSGNVVESVEVKVRKNIFSRLFTSFNTEPTFVERSGFGVEYTWVKEKLNPAESFRVKVTTNYILPFLVLLVIVFVLLGFKRYSESKVEVTKSVSPVKTKADEFALKVTICVKANKFVENVTLTDRIPGIVKIYKKFGILKPDKIDVENRRIRWNVGDLGAGETRLFNYIVYSKIGVVGKFSMPEALVVFEKNGKIHEINSNRVFFMSEQAKS